MPGLRGSMCSLWRRMREIFDEPLPGMRERLPPVRRRMPPHGVCLAARRESSRTLSPPTTKNLRRNLSFAFVYNFVGIPMAAGVLHPWLGILLSPMLASAAMNLSSVPAISNALRLRRATL